MTPPRATKAGRQLPSAADYQLLRARLLTEGYEGLLIVNGGGAAALLAFVQAVWRNDRALAKLTPGGIAFMVAGLFLAMLVPFLRFHHSVFAERPEPITIRCSLQRALRVTYQL